jgi:hypothetical protein
MTKEPLFSNPVLVLFAVLGITLVLGPAACAAHDANQITERVRVACAGDLNDAARNAACTIAIMQKPVR